MILREANSESLPLDRFPSVDTGASVDIPLVKYVVNGDDLSSPILEDVPGNLVRYQQDFTGQQSAWKLFTSLIPADRRVMLAEFQIITDGPGGVLSAVEQTNDDPGRWILEADIADIPDTKNLAFTFLHEFGHLLTLEPAQVPPDLQVFDHPLSKRARERAAAACADYFPGEGCSLPDSYVNIFYDRFWSGMYGEWDSIDRMTDDGRRDSKLHAFYHKYRDQFVDSYAATSPVEDIAESWAFYVLNTVPARGAIADQKLRFFAGYPELVTLRASILRRLCSINP